MSDLPPTYSDEQWASFCAGTWQKEIDRLRMDLDNYKLIARQAQKERDTIAEENYTLRVLLREVEWGAYSEFGASCPCCRGMHPDDDSNPYANHQVGHSATCELKAALEGR